MASSLIISCRTSFSSIWFKFGWGISSTSIPSISFAQLGDFGWVSNSQVYFKPCVSNFAHSITCTYLNRFPGNERVDRKWNSVLSGQLEEHQLTKLVRWVHILRYSAFNETTWDAAMFFHVGTYSHWQPRSPVTYPKWAKRKKEKVLPSSLLQRWKIERSENFVPYCRHTHPVRSVVRSSSQNVWEFWELSNVILKTHKLFHFFFFYFEKDFLQVFVKGVDLFCRSKHEFMETFSPFSVVFPPIFTKLSLHRSSSPSE